MSQTRNLGIFAQAKTEINIDLKAIRMEINENKSSFFLIFRLLLSLFSLLLFMLFRMIRKSIVRKRLMDRGLSPDLKRKLSNYVALGYNDILFPMAIITGFLILCYLLKSTFSNIHKRRSQIITSLNVSPDEIIENLVDELPDRTKEELYNAKLLEKDERNNYSFNQKFYSYVSMAFLVKPVEIDLIKEEKNKKGEIIKTTTTTEIQDEAFIHNYIKSHSLLFSQGKLNSLTRPGFMVAKNTTLRPLPEMEEEVTKHKKELRAELSKKIENFNEVYTRKYEQLLDARYKIQGLRK